MFFGIANKEPILLLQFATHFFLIVFRLFTKTVLFTTLQVHSGRLFALQTVRGAVDTANKRDHDITNDSVLHHNCALSTLFLPR